MVFEESFFGNLEEEHLVQQLEQFVSMLRKEKEQANLNIQEKLKDAKTRSLMTKYQMLFIKIEIYVTILVQIIFGRQKQNKLSSFLAIKQFNKDAFSKTVIIPGILFQKTISLFALTESLFSKRKLFDQIFAVTTLKFLVKVAQLNMDIQKNTQAVLANSISKKEGTECSFPLFVKTQNSNFHKSSKISDHNLETEIAEDRCQCNQDLLVRNKYLKARLLQTEKIGLVFTEELDAMMSLFIKKNENEIIRKGRLEY